MVAAGCAGPSFSYGDYEKKAAQTAKAADSEVQTARLAARAGADGRVTRPYLDVVLTGSETTLGDIQTSFGGVQPPDRRSDQLRDEVGTLLSDASDVLAALRIEVRRGHIDALPKVAAPLAALHEKLTAITEEHA
jgi:hypothetical protein